jgi:hypothetical protein
MACTAVGYYDSTGTTVTLAETWNGTSWSVQATPNPKGSGAGDSELVGVSCASDVACTAVGNYDNAPLAEAWNGTNWSVQSLPNPVGAEASFLGGISCTSAAACTAVGHYFNSFLSFMTLAETWNGTSWSVQPTPNPTGAALTGLYGVACTSATACAAVGSYSNRAGTSVSLAEAWNGTSWSLQSTPNPTGAEASFLDAVSCATAGTCTAVGSHVNSSGTSVTLAEEWSGTSWSLQSTPNPAGAKGSELSGVACALATACIAVGHYDDSAGKSVTLAEDWNGTSWSVQSTPNPAGAEGSELSGVACASAAGCIAVGSYSNSAGKGVTLAEEWNGTSWSVQSTPNPSGAKGSELSGVACASAAACTAVGSYTNSAGTSVTLAEARNGTSWSVQPSPNPKGAAAASLYGVSCLSATACTAVGSYTNGTGTGVTLAEDWNGTRWSVQSTPNPKGAVAGELDGVSCTAATACTAVGYFGSSAGTSGTLAEAWNGKSWSVQSTPDPKAATDSYLGSVACAAPATCTAAGYFSNSAGEPVTLAEARAG